MVMLTLIGSPGQLSYRVRYNSGQDYVQWERGSGGDVHYSPDASQHRNHSEQHVFQNAPVAARGRYGQLHAPRAPARAGHMAYHSWANACDPSSWENRQPAPVAAPLAGPVLPDTRSTIANVGLGHRTSSPYSSSDNTRHVMDLLHGLVEIFKIYLGSCQQYSPLGTIQEDGFHLSHLHRL